MTLPVWPGPDLLVDGFSRSPADPAARTKMDSGRTRVRRRHRVFPVSLQGTFLLRDAEYRVCVQFMEDTLNGWSSPFLLTIRDRKGVRQSRVQFAAPPAEALQSKLGIWQLDVQLETLNIY